MDLSFTTLYYVLSLFIVVKITLEAVGKRRRKAEAVRRGCGEPPRLPKKGLLGLGRIKERVKAARERRGLSYMMETLNELPPNVHTVHDSILGYHFLMTRDPENAQALLATQNHDFDIGISRTGSFSPLTGDGVFSAVGQSWKHSRAMVRSHFDREQVSDLELQERHVQTALRTLEVKQDGWTDTVDLAPLLQSLTFDIMTDVLFGQSVNSLYSLLPNTSKARNLESPDPEKLEFENHLRGAADWLVTRATLGRRYWICSPPVFYRHCRGVHRFVDHYVKAALQRVSEGRVLYSESSSKKEKLVFLDEMAKHTQDPVKLRSEALNVLISRTSTGSLMTYTCCYLARYPAVFQKLRDIVLQDFGTDPSGITFDNLRSCEYLNFCLKEALRMAAVIPMNARVSLRDTTLPRGGGADGTQPIFVPKGTDIFYCPYAMQHRKDLWGDDVEEFVPERWEARKGKFDWAFVPFGGGPRICLGQQFATTEAAYLLVRFLQRFDRVDNMESGPIKHAFLIVNRCDSARVRLHEATR